jgi:hypothetical protein
VLAAIPMLVVPFAVNMLWVHFSARSPFIPTATVALCGYGVLMTIHITLSKQSFGHYSLELVQLNEKELQFKSRGIAVAFWLMVALGAVVLLAFIR